MRTALALTIGALLLAGCGDDEPAGPAAPAPAGDEVAISMVDTLYKPARQSVRAGQKVVWTNDDPIPHTVTATDGADFDSGAVDAGGRYEWVAEGSGTVKYYCEIHPQQKGELILE